MNRKSSEFCEGANPVLEVATKIHKAKIGCPQFPHTPHNERGMWEKNQREIKKKL